MKPSHPFRRRLILTTILTALPLLSDGRQAYAACVADPAPPTFLCSSANTATQAIDVDNANVTTAPGFSVNAAVGNGISITGDGALKFTDTNGSAVAGAVYGLYAYAQADAGGIPGSVAIVADGDIAGGLGGISARNQGTGFISIVVDGTVTGASGHGIFAHNANVLATGDLTVTTGAGSTVTGAANGIEAINRGVGGDIAITVKGTVAGGANGINALNIGGGVDLTITTDAGSLVTARDNDGINAESYGTGNLAITIRGNVAGAAGLENGDGIDAFNREYGVDLTIVTEAGSSVTGGHEGIEARSEGSGDLKITAGGTVSGGRYGIWAKNSGDGNTIITVGAAGVVEGGATALLLDSNYGQAIDIINDGVIRNRSGAADDLAIETASGPDTEIGDIYMENRGALVGRILFANGDDSLISRGIWDTRGENDFGYGDDFLDNKGVLLVAGDSAAEEQTSLVKLERLRSSGLITLVDGGTGDRLAITDGDYESDGGALAVDVALSAPTIGWSDVLFIGGNVTGGVTKVSVNVVDVIGANTEGITVVEVVGDTEEGDFVLMDGPISAGFFTWDMRFDDIANVHELYTSGIGVGAYELAAGITGAQDIWHQTTGTLLQRQADLRPLLGGTQVTPVADFAQPVAPTSVGRVGPGFWMTGIGAWLERDAEQDGFTLDRKQAIYGGLAGFDFATEGAGDAWLFGIFAGYVGSTLKFNETNTQWRYDGPSVGAYATYLNDAFYADLTVKADFLSISIDPDKLSSQEDDSDTDAVNLGGRIDTGYKFGGAEGGFIEPQATLAVVNTDIDDADIYGGTADFDDETSVKGRLGLRLGYDHIAANAVVYSSDLTASVWHEFNGSNNVSITASDFPTFGVADDTVATLGDISLGFGVVAPEGWSGFVRGNYQFAEDYEAITGNAGARYAW